MSSEHTQRRFDLIALGRAAVDLYGEQIGGRLEDMRGFAKYLGGCPANISVGAARLGLKPAMLTRVGDEHMGRFVRETLAAEGVDVSHVKTDPQRLTGLVVLGIRDQNTFPLIFYRENCADMAVDAADFDFGFIGSAKALLVTGTHFTTASVDRASRQAIAYAKQAGTKIVLDIDYRPVLWGLTGHDLGEERFIASETVSAHLQSIVPHCDLIVGTEEEIHIAGGSTDTLAALRRLRTLTNATFVVKRGAAGCTIFPDAIVDRFEDAIDCPGFPVDVFNVLGAGDGFMAGLLRGWLRGADWKKSAAYANACGALVVSRHGCAPAMPSWEELAHYLERSDRTARLHDDPSVIRLHRATTARQNWPQVTALAFDHRRQFEELAAKHGADADKIVRFKEIIAQAAGSVPATGIILDDRFGRAALHRFSDGARWIARPVELPGSVPLAFEAGSDLTGALRLWPSRQVVKCLVVYGADDPADLRQAQETELLKLQSACQANGLEWLLEIIPPQRDLADNDAAIGAAIERLYEIGLMPDWWKLPPMINLASWQAVAAVVRKHDAHCHGILILGLDANETALQKSFVAAAGEPLVKGFAIGRSIFWAVAKQWFADNISDAQAAAAIEGNYRRVHSLWQAARAAAAQTVSDDPPEHGTVAASQLR
jgi:5-dehydro-2-deoxygluconokinase